MALRGVDDTCFVVCEVWDEKDRTRRHLALKDANGFEPPCDDILAVMAEHPKFERIDDTVDQESSMCLCFRGEENLGGGGEDDVDA